MASRPLRTVIASLALAAALSLAAPEVLARERSRAVQAASPRVYKQLERAHEQTAEERYPDARETLEKLDGMSGLNAYERSLVQQAWGYFWAGQGRYANAARAFERCLAEAGLAPEHAQTVRYNLGQLYVADGRYQQGVDTLRAWFDEVQGPNAEAYLLVANAYGRLERHDEALRWAERGVAKSPEPREEWLALLLSLYFEVERFADVTRVLEQLVERFPKREYWLQLSAAYAELGKEQESLAALELAYLQGLLETSQELERLARLLLYNDAPYQAARLLETELASGRVQGTAANWELLADGWLNAREVERAVQPLERAATLAEGGDPWVRLARVHVEQERWEAARSAAQKAIARGGLEDPGRAYLLLGVASFHADRREESRQAFARATRHATSERSAQRWLRHLDSLR